MRLKSSIFPRDAAMDIIYKYSFSAQCRHVKGQKSSYDKMLCLVSNWARKLKLFHGRMLLIHLIFLLLLLLL